MSDAADTSAEAVEQIAARSAKNAQDWLAGGFVSAAAKHGQIAATLRALLAERDALREALRAAVVAYTGTKGTQP